jgi:arylsulfatase A-like enzyme
MVFRMARPNIIFIMVDNQSAFTLGCYGNEEIYTPNLDAMAFQGGLFSEAYCSNAMCSPGRASALTGLMPSGHGVQNWLDDRLATQWPANWSAIDEFSNLPTLLKEAGYTTGLSGKYHLGHSDKPKNGFDFWVSLDRGHTANFYNNTITDNGETKVVPEHSVDYFAKRARDFILDKQASDDPFFLFVAPNGPYGHWPAIKGPCGTRHQSRYENMEITSVPREGLTAAACSVCPMTLTLCATIFPRLALSMTWSVR